MPRKSKVAPYSGTKKERKDGRVVRQMTIYLPEELRKKLKIYCMENDIEISSVIEECVVEMLGVKS